MVGKRKPDLLDRTEVFLSKRDGTDKVLKVIRYSSKLLLSLQPAGGNPEAWARLKAFEASVGTSRKAFRIGKFLQNVNKLRKQPLGTQLGALELLSNGGEAVYYFTEQLTWLVRSGLLHKRHAARLQQISAWAEVVGYCGSSTLNCLRIAASLEREAALQQDLRLRQKDPQSSSRELEAAIRQELALLQARRFLRTLAVIQDMADALLTLPDLGDGRWAPVQNRALLALAGLLSAAISIHKVWGG